MRPAYPTAAELQRMPWSARKTLRDRLNAQRKREARLCEPEPDQAPYEWDDTYVLHCHNQYQRGDRTKAITAGDREYQRRARERKRAEEAAAAKAARRGPLGSWSVTEALALREQGMDDRDIADRYGIHVKSLQARIRRTLAKQDGEAA